VTCRVVISGAGVICPTAVGIENFWRSCLDGEAAIAAIPASWHRYATYHSHLWAPLPEVDAEAFGITRGERLSLDPVTLLAAGAAHEALGRAGFTLEPTDGSSHAFQVSGLSPARAGVFLGTGIGGANSFLHSHVYHLLHPAQEATRDFIARWAPSVDAEDRERVLEFLAHGKRYHPFVVSMLMPNAPAAYVGIKFSLTGQATGYAVACAAGTVAVGNAFRAVRDGRVDVALGGGCEYLYDDHGHIFRGFDVAGTLVRDCADPERANRPFDKKRSGFLFSQGGAAVLVLEELEHARRRGATIMAEIVGYGESFDAHSMMALAPGGGQIERMLRDALAEAAIDAGEVDYVNAHGTGTENNDKTEAEVIERVFGTSVRVNATKSLLGHSIGASGAIEALVTALSLRDGTTHICKNLENPVRNLNFVREIGKFDLRVALSQSFAFGGHNAALVMRRYDA